MEYNEPLNLSIKKKPIAVVTPSSSSSTSAAANKPPMAASATGPANPIYMDECDRLENVTPTVESNSDARNRSPSLTKEMSAGGFAEPRETTDDNDSSVIGDCVAAAASNLQNQSTATISNPSAASTASVTSSAAAAANLSSGSSIALPNSVCVSEPSSATPILSSLFSSVNNASNEHTSSAQNLNLVDLLYRSSSSTSSTLPSSDLSPNPIDTNARKYSNRTPTQSISPFSHATAADASNVPNKMHSSIADAAHALSEYLNQQQSLDIAKMHLEQYLKITNQYLHSTLEGANMTPNEQINHLIRTNILTNKIAANNLISIINKLLEQNVISEYYFKHASRLSMQSYDNGISIDGDKAHDRGNRSPASTPSPPLPPSLQGHSELLKQLAQRQFAESNDYDHAASDDETSDNLNNSEHDTLDYDETIKKETIPIASSPFLSYLNLHFSQDLAKRKAWTPTTTPPPKFYNGSIAIPSANSLSPIEASSPLSPMLFSAKKQHKSHRIHSESSSSNCISNNNNYTKHSAKHLNAPFDLSMSLSQRLLND